MSKVGGKYCGTETRMFSTCSWNSSIKEQFDKSGDASVKDVVDDTAFENLQWVVLDWEKLSDEQTQLIKDNYRSAYKIPGLGGF